MGTRIVPLSAAWAATLFAATLWAEEPAPPAKGHLLAQTKWLKLEIVGGRIVARTSRCCQNRFEAEAISALGARQSLSVDWSLAGVALRFEETFADQRLVLEISPKGQLTISHWDDGNNVDAQTLCVQPPTGKVSLTFGGETKKTVSAGDFWQLMLLYEDECRAHLLPLLNSLRSDWELASQLDTIKTALLEQARSDSLAQRQAWQRDVAGLANPNFVRRQAADQALRASGPAVLAFLRQLDERELDAEQRRRVRLILTDLSDGHADSPALVAEWLVADKRVWLALLARGELEQRVSAADHLSKLCRRALPFDPTGSAELRTAQLAELTAKLAQP